MALDLIPHKPLLDKFLACTTQEDLQAIITNGKSRPVAIPDDQKELDNIAKHLFEILQKRYQEEASSSSTL